MTAGALTRRGLLAGFAATAGDLLLPEPRRVYSFLPADSLLWFGDGSPGEVYVTHFIHDEMIVEGRPTAAQLEELTRMLYAPWYREALSGDD